MNTTTRNFLLVFAVLVVVNIVGLWIFFFLQSKKLDKHVVSPGTSVADTTTFAANSGNSQLSALLSTSSVAGDNSWNAVIATLAAQIQDLNQRITTLENNHSKKSGTTKSTPSPSVKESVIYVGSGSTANRDWTDVSGAQTDINLDNFSHIKSVHFEAGLSIVGGEAHARLVNKTTGGVFYDSEVSNNTSQGMWISSRPLYLLGGNNTYSVQLKSTSGETANLIGARIRIIVQ